MSLLVVVAGCHSDSSKGLQVKRIVSDSERIASYKPRKDSISAHWHQKILSLAKEPDLKNVKNEQYRLLFLLSGGHITFYRLEDDTNKYFLTIKELKLNSNPAEPNKIDSLKSIKRIQVPDSVWTKFKTLIDNSYFWGIDHTEGEGNEFFSWKLEGHRKTADLTQFSSEPKEAEYHSVTTGGNRKSDLNKACNLLISLADSTKSK